MKAIILAAGYATRLYPLTINKPKALLTIGKQTILDFVVNEIKTLPGVDEIIIVTNDRFYGQFCEWNNLAQSEVKITVLNDNTSDDTNKLGAIGDIQFVIDEMEINDDILVMASDNIFTFKLIDFYNDFISKNKDMILVAEIENKEDLKRMANVVLTEDGRVVDMVEKPAEPISDVAAFASYFYTKETVPMIAEYLKQGNNPDAPGFFPSWLYKQKDVYAYKFEGECYDIGTPQAYKEIGELFENKEYLMKKVWKIVLGIAVILIVATAAVVVWQWDNISALYIGITYSDEKIEKKLEENKKKLAEHLKKENILDQKIIDGFSKEDEKKLAKGEITVEEAVEKLFGSNEESDTPNNSEPTANGESKENNSKDSEDRTSGEKTDKNTDSKSNGKNQASSGKGSSTSSQDQSGSNQQTTDNTSGENGKQQQIIKGAVQEMYALKAEFISRLGNIERTGKRMYIALGKEGMTKENKMKIADQLLPQLTAAESECDAKVETVLSKLSSDLNAIGADTSIVGAMREQYQNEKQLQKSSMISEYM